MPRVVCLMQQSRNANQKPGPEASIQELASRAASRYMASTVKSVKIPKTAYDFEVSWRALSDDTAQQIQLLKVYFQPFIFYRTMAYHFLLCNFLSSCFASSQFHRQAYQRFSRTHFLLLFSLTSWSVQPQFSGVFICHMSFCTVPIWDHGWYLYLLHTQGWCSVSC